MSDLPTRTLTDDYVHHLATRIAGRLREGYDLPDALGETLRERAPVRLDLPSHGSDTSVFGVILRLGLLAGAGLAANYAAKMLVGKGLVDLIRDQMGGDQAGYTVNEKYSAVHGTAGAEMPDPAASRNAGATAFATPATPRPSTGTPSSGAAMSERPTPVGTPAPQTPPSTPPSTPAPAHGSTTDRAASRGGDGAGSTPTVKHTAGGELPDADAETSGPGEPKKD